MYGFSKRERGAVSVFLVIILVPCMLVASIFVDVGRVYLSKSMAESAADMALNSLMTQYDADFLFLCHNNLHDIKKKRYRHPVPMRLIPSDR